MPIASMTALGSSSSTVGQAVGNIIDYLEGNNEQTRTVDSAGDTFSDADRLVDYYADTTKIDSPGWWSGRGVGGHQLEGPVDPEMLAKVLLGRHPTTGEQLVASAGSAGRARANTELTVRQAAEELGLSESKITKLAAAGAKRAVLLEAGENVDHIAHWLNGTKVARQWRFPTVEIEREQRAGLGNAARTRGSSDRVSVNQSAKELGVTPRAVRQFAAAGAERARLLAAGLDASHVKRWLDGEKSGRLWTFARGEVERAAGAREAPRVVVGIDFTVSFEKSISLLWVNAEPEQRTVIENAIKAGVQAGVSHLEDHGLQIRTGRGATTADGVWAASYLHLTNRSLEPQLHVHTVIANVAASGKKTQTIDARGLYREATTAGYLAGAETRRMLSEQLGVGWDRPDKGTMEVAGVPEAAIDAMSTRRAEVMALADELGYDTPKSRQVAALATRARKQHPEDFDSLVDSWRDLTARNGFGVHDADAIMSNVARGPVVTIENASVHAPVYADKKPEGERVRGVVELDPVVSSGGVARVEALDAQQSTDLFAWLGSASGLTRSSGVFTRSESTGVLHHVMISPEEDCYGSAEAVHAGVS